MNRSHLDHLILCIKSNTTFIFFMFATFFDLISSESCFSFIYFSIPFQFLFATLHYCMRLCSFAFSCLRYYDQFINVTLRITLFNWPKILTLSLFRAYYFNCPLVVTLVRFFFHSIRQFQIQLTF